MMSGTINVNCQETGERKQSFTQGLYEKIFVFCCGLPNDELLACMLATHWTGGTTLPKYMGLCEEAYLSMLSRHFPGLQSENSLPIDAVELSCHKEARGSGQDEMREIERQELRALLMFHCACQDRSEMWMADIVAGACMGSNHLWQDLGLWSRQDLSVLMSDNFPELALKNDRNMKWKKFLYKQLCIQDGIYTCRSPSCEGCADYQACFGPEE